MRKFRDKELFQTVFELALIQNILKSPCDKWFRNILALKEQQALFAYLVFRPKFLMNLTRQISRNIILSLLQILSEKWPNKGFQKLLFSSKGSRSAMISQLNMISACKSILRTNATIAWVKGIIQRAVFLNFRKRSTRSTLILDRRLKISWRTAINSWNYQNIDLKSQRWENYYQITVQTLFESVEIRL